VSASSGHLTTAAVGTATAVAPKLFIHSVIHSFIQQTPICP